MKSTLLSLSILLFVSIFTGCKKDENETSQTKSKIIGKWQVVKVDVKSDRVGMLDTTITTNYTSADYIDFKDVQVNLFLAGDQVTGQYGTGLGNTLFLDFSSKDLDCTINKLTANQLEFTGAIIGADPKVIETYYLKR
jgi:hypothetical protein